MYIGLESKQANKRIRESGIESLKIIAIFMIVLFHVVQTLVSNSSIITNNSYVINISNATTNVQNIILLVFYHFGSLGNSIFFICSTWFMLNSNRYNKQKWLLMLVEIWFISISILFITFVILRANIPASLMIKSLFPTLFMNNWYMTCYLIFYPLHPILNNVINKMNQKQLFRCTAALSFMYILMDFIEWDWFFPSIIILWITIYFCVAYMKKYLTDFANSMKKNIISFSIALFGLFGLILLTEITGLHISFLQDKMTRWATNCNPFTILMAIALFNIARKISFKNKVINYISSSSLLVYIIHENIILRGCYRPFLWIYIHDHFGYDYVIFWTICLAFAIFVFAHLAAIMYKILFGKLVKKVSDSLYGILRKRYLALEKHVLMTYR